MGFDIPDNGTATPAALRTEANIQASTNPAPVVKTSPRSVPKPSAPKAQPTKAAEIVDELPLTLADAMELYTHVSKIHTTSDKEKAAKVKRVKRVGKHFFDLQQVPKAPVLGGEFRLSKVSDNHARKLMKRVSSK